MEEFDFIVVGAGIAGASAAYELAGHGRVLIVERESQPGYHTTGRSAAFYAQAYGNAVIRRLTIGCKGFFDNPPPGFCDGPLLNDSGALFLARADQRDALAALYEETREVIPTVRLLERDAALELVPVVRPEYLAAALYEPDSKGIDVHMLHHGFLRGARKNGARLLCDAEILGLERTGGMWRVESSAGRFAAPVLVNAAGAWCDEIAKLAGARPVGLVPKRRTIITFDPPEGCDVSRWPLTVDVDEKFYFKPDAGRILGSPADETPMPPCDAQPDDIDVAVAVDRLETATTMKIRRIISKWAGLRSFVKDKSPVVGFDDEVAGFFWLAGQGGYGIQTAPSMGKVAACLATGRPLPPHLTDLGLDPADLAPNRLR